MKTKSKKQSAKSILAWHFPITNFSNVPVLAKFGRDMSFPSVKEIKVGKTYSTKQDVRLCYRGMHGSIRLRDAFEYNKKLQEWRSFKNHGWLWLSRVRIEGNINKGKDKVAGQRRKVLGLLFIDLEFIRKLANHLQVRFTISDLELKVINNRRFRRSPYQILDIIADRCLDKYSSDKYSNKEACWRKIEQFILSEMKNRPSKIDT